MTILKSSDLASNNFENFTINDNTTRGAQTYWTRLRWSNNTGLKLSQTVTLPKGYYTLSATALNYNNNITNNKLELFAGSNSITAANSNTKNDGAGWKTLTVSFSLTEETSVELGFRLTHATESNGEQIAGIDNFQLMWTDPDLAAAQLRLGGFIKRGNALNTVLGNADLVSAITTAENVLSSATTSSEVNSATTTLSDAITAAVGNDVVSLSNANFDTDIDIDAAGTHHSTALITTNAGAYEVSGWTGNFGKEWVYGASSVYDNQNAAINGTSSPSSDMFGSKEGGTLHFSSGWNNSARYKQNITNLPAGRYVFYYEAYNQNPTASSVNSNYFGVSGASGDFYGTTNSFVFSEQKAFEYGKWTAQAFEFDIAKTADITFNIGITGSTSGSGNGAKLWVDNVLVYRIGDVMISEDEASAIISSVEELDDAIYNATDKSNLASAFSTFSDNKTLENYNVLNAALIAANASIEVYTALGTAITNAEGWTTNATTVTDPIRAKYTNGTYSNETTAADIYSEYQAAEIAALVAADATVFTSAILNPSFEKGDLTGWSAATRDDTGVKQNNNANYSITSGDAIDGNYLFNSWGGTAENNVYQTVANLPAGTYTLSALVAGFNGESIVLAANDETTTITVAGDKTVGYTANVLFTLAEAADVVIKVSNTKSQSGSDASFIKADNFRLVKGNITTTDFTDLNAALETAEANTLGFDEGEYAPYNNVAAVKALNAAKAVDQNVPMLVTDYEAVLSALTSAIWTKNNEELNAFYDGNFALQNENTTAPTALSGWNNPEGIRQLIKNNETYPGLNSTSGNAAVFAWGNSTLIYGNNAGYTMPLDANTTYELTMKHCGWSDGDLGYVKVTVLNGTEGLNEQTTKTATKRITEEEPWTEYKVLFKTGEAGDYVFGMWTSKHTVFTDLVLKKAVAEEVTIDENATTVPTANEYANVTLTRTLKGGAWNTFSVPFNMDIPEGWTVKEFDSATDNVLTFKEATTIVAGKPYMVRPTADVVNPTFEGVTVQSIEGTADGKGDYKFAAQLYNKTLATDGTVAYMTTDGQIKKLTSGGIKGLRAYFIIPADVNPSGVRIAFTDGEMTGIESMSNVPTTDDRYYDLQGRRVLQPAKGIYVVNGKKVIVK